MKKKWLFILGAVALIISVSGCKKNYYNPDPADSSVNTITQKFIVLESAELKLHIGDTTRLNARISPVSSEKITYSSSNAKVAAVDDSGVVYAAASGTATVTVATQDGKTTAKCEVTVSDVRKMNLSGNVPLTAMDGDSFTVKVSFENCTYPSVKIVADCGGGSIQTADSRMNFGSDLSQNQVTGNADITFRFSGSKNINSVRIIGFDCGEVIDMKEYDLTKFSSDSGTK